MNITSNQYNNVSFNGFTKHLKNKIFLDGQKDITQLIEKHPNSRGVVGQLPNYIFQKLPKENRAAAIKEILDVFDKVSNTLRGYYPEGDAFIFKPELRHRPECVNEWLTDVLQKHNIIRKHDYINVSYIGQGGKGKVFKLDGICDIEKDNEYVIKVFHQIKGDEWHKFKSHGCYAELNNAIYWRNHEGHDTHRGKFFFGSLDSGYLVSKFIDEDARLPKRVVDEYKYGIKCTDEEKSGVINGYNRLKGYNYDYGGMRVVNAIKNTNPIARKYLEKLRNAKVEDRTKIWEELFQQCDTEKKKEGITLAIKHLDNEIKTKYLDKCLALKSTGVNRAAGYVLKYLDHEDAVDYFEKLVKTDDIETQRILFNEIPLLAKWKNSKIKVYDDIGIALEDIVPERVYTYYMLAEKHALPETIEHLASYVHLLPKKKIKEQYMKLTAIKNYNLQERLIYKLSYLPNNFQDFAVVKLANVVTDKILQQRLLNSSTGKETKKYVQDIIDGKL